MEKFPFSTATIQVAFQTNFFKTENPPAIRQRVKKDPCLTAKEKKVIIDVGQKARKKELSKLFRALQTNNRCGEYEFTFKGDATRATSSKLKRHKKSKEKVADAFYNSMTIRRVYKTNGVQFNATCLLFFNTARITLGLWTHRKIVAADYIHLLRTALGPHHRFKITAMKTIFVNVAFKFSPECLNQLPSTHETFLQEQKSIEQKGVLKSKNNTNLVFNLQQVFDCIKNPYEETLKNHTLTYNPLMTNQNKVHVSVKGRGGGCLSLYRTGTIMLLGFSRVKTIVDEFYFLSTILEEKFNYPLKNQVELYKRKKLAMGGLEFEANKYPNFLL
jgi:hypothetical protein